MAAIIKCKMCGGDLIITEGSPIAECEFCGTQQTIPNLDDEKKLVQFERAERLRKQCEFDKAAGVYESIVAEFRQEAEGYWGLVLCKYGIEYVDDPASGKKVPTCHRSSFESILEDSNFEQTLENADAEARKLYREEAKQIEDIRKGILEVSNKEAPYDVFICYKETDAKGERTLDSVLAQDLYDALTDKDYRVFFARITLEDKLGQEYEPYIFAALNSAKVMLVVGTDYEYYNAVWVKNEWSRFLKLMEKNKDKHLVPCYKGIDAYDMPKEFARLQAQDLGKMGAVQDILRNMEKFIPRNTNTTQVVQKVGGLDDKVTDLMDQGYKAMDSKNWKQADELFKQALAACASTSDRFLIEQNVKQLREEAQFQIRRKKCRKHNLILTLILAILISFTFIRGNEAGVEFIWENRDMIYSDFIDLVDLRYMTHEEINQVGLGIYAVFNALVIISTLLGAKFVGKKPGAKSGWVTCARVMAILGLLWAGPSAGALYYAITMEMDMETAAMAWPLCNWIAGVVVIDLISFIGLFFRRKV